MKIVIAGAGEVGTHLAKLLSKEGLDIILIDNDENKLHAIDANYNLMTMTGSPTAFKVLKNAKVDKCDLFIAVTPFETRNIVSCSFAKKLGARKTVARIDNYEFLKPEYQQYFAEMGVDDLIYPENFASLEIKTALQHSWARNWFELYNGELILTGIKLRENCQIVGMKLKDLAMEGHPFHICAIRRQHETIIPRGDDHLELNDIAYFIYQPDSMKYIMQICGKQEKSIKKILIMGGSRIGVQLANMLDDSYKINSLKTTARNATNSLSGFPPTARWQTATRATSTCCAKKE